MFTIVGIRRVTSKKDGSRYVELHLTSDDKFVEGLRVDCIFVREDMISDISALSLGAICEVYYNRVGRVDRVSL